MVNQAKIAKAVKKKLALLTATNDNRDQLFDEWVEATAELSAEEVSQYVRDWQRENNRPR